MDDRVVYGKHAVLEALRSGTPVRRLYIARDSSAARDKRLISAMKQARVKPNESPREALDRVAGVTHHQGVVAVLESYGFLELGSLLERALARYKDPVLVALDQVTDPHNLGAILRSTEALGGAGAIVPERRSAPMTGTVEKAAAGAASRLPVAQVVNLSNALEAAKEHGFWVIGTDARAGDPCFAFDFARPTVLVIGSEGKGMRDRVRATCDALVAIPLAGEIGSLNASVAAGIVLYEIFRRRLQPPGP